MEGKFTITSNSFKHEGNLAIKYTAYADNISPHLKWVNPPKGT